MMNRRNPPWLLLMQFGLAAALGFGLFGGCTSPPQASDAHLLRRAPAEVAAAPLWPRFSAALGWPAVGAAFQSEHLEPIRQAMIRVSPEAAARYQQWVLGATLEPGSALLEQLSNAPGSAPERYLAMEKEGSSWSYLRLDSEGRVLETDASLCQRCHAEAVSDELFGAPRSVTR